MYFLGIYTLILSYILSFYHISSFKNYRNIGHTITFNFPLKSSDGDSGDISSLFEDIDIKEMLEIPKEEAPTDTQEVVVEESKVSPEAKTPVCTDIYSEDNEGSAWTLALPKEYLYTITNENIWKDIPNLKEFESKPVRYTTRNEGDEKMRLSDIYEHLSKKPLSEVYVPIESALPSLDKINPVFFTFDIKKHLGYYLEHLNGDFNPQIHKGHVYDTTTIDYFLNREYIQEFKRPFPPPEESIKIAQDHLIRVIPEILESLAQSIKNDPNCKTIPSPPYHKIKKIPPAIKSGEFYKNMLSDDYEKLSDLTGVIDTSKGYDYPYSNIEPLLDRMSMRLFYNLLKDRDFGVINPKKLYCLGKKKTAIAGVYLEPGNGHLSINGRDGYQYLDYDEEKLEHLFASLDVLRIQKYFNVVATVKGGGISGQASAISHAITTYIYTSFFPKAKSMLRYLGLVTRDVRVVERKKPNLHKARRAEQYSKR